MDGGPSDELHALLLKLQARLEAHAGRWIAQYGLHSVTAQDVVQDVFAKALEKSHLLPWWDGESGVRGYLVRMTHWQVIDYGKKAGRDIVELHGLEPEKPGPGLPAPTGSVTRADEDRKRDAEIAALRTELRIVVELVLHHGLTPQEIAELLEIDVRTVRKRYRRAAEILNRKMGGSDGE